MPAYVWYMRHLLEMTHVLSFDICLLQFPGRTCCSWATPWGGGAAPGKPGSPAEAWSCCGGRACPMGGIMMGKPWPGGKPKACSWPLGGRGI